ncbi:hypothetical protein BTR14_03230 [Rhizobium rhizosphaerae]|uniref:Uncharacterized protein n=1 Tax=Xaviernesmea rhizosphaerae TaxID=1672749 RepID=A0ABX3PHK9_9HYPH|nr:hypothetical protein [Xaviernesmea rhizosphaerae]OQP87595.1 hypothetical protein BTR14_03230 [Xaviernesmea rhizosphaerae]
MSARSAKRVRLAANRGGSPAILAFRRLELERWIEKAIALLDQLDGDPDLEPYLAGTGDERELDLDSPGVRGVSEGDDDCDTEPNGDEQDACYGRIDGGSGL